MEHEQAIGYLSIAIELVQAEWWKFNAYYIRGESYAGLDQHHRAIEDFDQVIALYPSDLYYRVRGDSYAALGQHQRAIEDYDQAIALDSDAWPNYQSRGRSYTALGQHQKAQSDKDKVCNLAPTGWVSGC
jgi:tetratricopeptide (TPR) repeat protein